MARKEKAMFNEAAMKAKEKTKHKKEQQKGGMPAKEMVAKGIQHSFNKNAKKMKAK